MFSFEKRRISSSSAATGSLGPGDAYEGITIHKALADDPSAEISQKKLSVWKEYRTSLNLTKPELSGLRVSEAVKDSDFAKMEAEGLTFSNHYERLLKTVGKDGRRPFKSFGASNVPLRWSGSREIQPLNRFFGDTTNPPTWLRIQKLTELQSKKAGMDDSTSINPPTPSFSVYEMDEDDDEHDKEDEEETYICIDERIRTSRRKSSDPEAPFELKLTIKTILKKALEEVVLVQPKDPLHYMACWLYRYRWNPIFQECIDKNLPYPGVIPDVEFFEDGMLDWSFDDFWEISSIDEKDRSMATQLKEWIKNREIVFHLNDNLKPDHFKPSKVKLDARALRRLYRMKLIRGSGTSD